MSIEHYLGKTASQPTSSLDRYEDRLEMRHHSKAEWPRRRCRTGEKCDAPRFWWRPKRASRYQDSRDRCSLVSRCAAARQIYIAVPRLVFGVLSAPPFLVNPIEKKRRNAGAIP